MNLLSNGQRGTKLCQNLSCGKLNIKVPGQNLLSGPLLRSQRSYLIIQDRRDVGGHEGIRRHIQFVHKDIAMNDMQ
jgi:hypothetical protein